MNSRRDRIIGGMLILTLLVCSSNGQSQSGLELKSNNKPAKNSDEVRNTSVELEILTDDGNGIRAQEWRLALESLEISLAFRRGEVGEELETTEKNYGKFRRVTAIGRMDRAGKLTFADQVFQPGDRNRIKSWVEDLQKYGAQGSPLGKPLWGLNEEQFSAVYASLLEVTTNDLRDMPLEKAIRNLPLPFEYPLEWSPAARKRLSEAEGKDVVRQSTLGFTTATALAVILNDAGLGFRPVRTPAGSMELLIDVPGKSEDVWPVGWPLKLSRQKAAPKLFVLNQIFLDDKTLLDVLGMASQSAEIPVLFNYAELDHITDDWAGIPILYRPRQATWHTVVRDVLNKGKLTFDLYQDEAGRVFLYVTTIKSKREPPK